MGCYMGLTTFCNETGDERGLVSVVITTYNSASTIYDVLDALLVQQYPLELIEIVIVDDRSQDDTLNIIEKFGHEHGEKFYGFKIIAHEQNLGVSRARNDGIKASCGEYILILDSDVVLPPNAIKEMTEFLSSNPDVGCCVLLHKPDADNIILRWHYEVRYGKNGYTMAATSAAMLKREVLEKTGLYDEALGPPFSVDEDIEFGARIWKAGYKVVMLGNIVAHHLTERRKKHTSSLTSSRGEKKKEEEISLTRLIAWFIGYFKERQGLSWFKFLRSLPLRLKFRYLFHSTFLPMALTSVVSLMIGLQALLLPAALLTLATFLDVLRDFFNPNQLHKSCVLALLACINRSSRTLSMVVHILRAELCRRLRHRIIV